MDIILLVLTVISLVLAFVMSVAAWRLVHAERARSAARVSALAAAAADFSSELADQQPARAESVVAREPVVAREAVNAREAVMAREAAALKDSRPAAPWAPARVSMFPLETDDLRRSHASDRLREAPVEVSRKAEPHAPLSDSFLGGAVAVPTSGGRQRGLAYAAVVLFLVIVTGAYFTLFDDASSHVSAAGSAGATAAPLELVSLRHERQGSRLSITGLVRNPARGSAAEHLAAVVFLFDQQSAFLTSARADIDVTKLTPGDESPFVIALDAPANVARYRVSFRSDEGVVPHVDRRGQEPIARELP
jgi:hypothetical protein